MRVKHKPIRVIALTLLIGLTLSLPGGSFSVASARTQDAPAVSVQFNSGPPANVVFTTQGNGATLESITVVTQENVSVVISEFTPGTTQSVVVTATKIDPSSGAVIIIIFCFRLSDDSIVCIIIDPVLTTLQAKDSSAGTRRQTFTGIPKAENKITVQNGDPGLRSMKVIVNGKKFRLREMQPRSVAFLDVSSAMVEGNNNVITLVGTGKRGASAEIFIRD